MAEDNQELKKVFMSYSWTSPEHEQWVIDLAERLMSDGIDVVLDKWELTEGQDKYAFMEKMVTDKTINKVLAVCDKGYAEKADGREGGVGTESQIISREVYEKVDQKKFIPIVTEFENGEACVPTFFKSRIYIDMSTVEKQNENYERLIRSIYDKPLDKKPALGKPPSYILDDSRIPSRTLSKLYMFKEAVMKGRGQVINGLASDYLEGFSEALEDFRIDTTKNDVPLDEIVVSSINQSLPYRDEFIDFLTFVIRYANQIEIHEEIRRSLEGMLRYTTRPQDVNSWQDMYADNFRFILRELFLYLIAALIKKEKATELDIYLERSYFYSPTGQGGTGINPSYTIFDSSTTALDIVRADRLALNRHNVSAELIHKRATNTDLNFDLLMQTDLILWVRSMLNREDMGNDNWWPRTMIYAKRYRTLSLFARGASRRYFEFLKRLMKVESKNDFIEKFNSRYTSYNFESMVSPRSMGYESILNIDNLETRP